MTFSSCTKEYECNCNYIDKLINGTEIENSVSYSFMLPIRKHKDAKNICSETKIILSNGVTIKPCELW